MAVIEPGEGNDSFMRLRVPEYTEWDYDGETSIDGRADLAPDVMNQVLLPLSSRWPAIRNRPLSVREKPLLSYTGGAPEDCSGTALDPLAHCCPELLPSYIWIVGSR